jgi:hypothetical protein
MGFFARLTISSSVSIKSQPNCPATSLATTDLPVPENPVITILLAWRFISKNKNLWSVYEKSHIGARAQPVLDFEMIALGEALKMSIAQPLQEGKQLRLTPLSLIS